MSDTKPTEKLNVAHIASLSRLDLTEEETATFQTQLDAIMTHIEHLQSVDVEGIEPTAYPTPVFDNLRADEPGTSIPQSAVLQNAPKQSQDQIQVPKVIVTE